MTHKTALLFSILLLFLLGLFLLGFSSQVLSFSETYSDAIEAISTFVLVLITTVTIFFNYATVSVMRREYELNSRPYVGLERDVNLTVQKDETTQNGLAVTTDWIQFKFSIANIGKVAATFHVRSSVFMGSEQSQEDMKEIVLYPGQVMYHWSHFVIPETIVSELAGAGLIEYEYWALGLSNKKYFHKRSFALQKGRYIITNDEAGIIKE